MTGVQQPFTLQVVAKGDVGDLARQYATEKLTHVARYVHEPVLFGRVTLTRVPDPAASHKAEAEATLDLNGRPVHARAAAHGMTEAIDLLEKRLRNQLQHLSRGPKPPHKT